MTQIGISDKLVFIYDVHVHVNIQYMSLLYYFPLTDLNRKHITFWFDLI